MTLTRGSPTLTYTKQSDGYICYQRTRIEKKPPASSDWKFVSTLLMGTLLLAACLFFIADVDVTSSGHYHSHQHHHKHQVEGFLRKARTDGELLLQKGEHYLHELEDYASTTAHDVMASANDVISSVEDLVLAPEASGLQEDVAAAAASASMGE